jgi:hypothetical protein
MVCDDLLRPVQTAALAARPLGAVASRRAAGSVEGGSVRAVTWDTRWRLSSLVARSVSAEGLLLVKVLPARGPRSPRRAQWVVAAD